LAFVAYRLCSFVYCKSVIVQHLVLILNVIIKVQ